jgi:hypothetical protein
MDHISPLHQSIDPTNYPSGVNRRRQEAEGADEMLLCGGWALLVAAAAVLVPHVGQAEGPDLENDDLLVKLVNNMYIVLDLVGQRPLRQVWAIPRPGNAVDELEVWRAHGLTNKIEPFLVGDLRMSEDCFNVLLEELETHPLMNVDGNAFRELEPHDTRRKLMAWLKWVGCNASIGDVDKFSGIAKGTLVRQGRRGQGVLGKVTMALYDILVNGIGHNCQQGEIVFPRTSQEIRDCMRGFSDMLGCQVSLVRWTGASYRRRYHGTANVATRTVTLISQSRSSATRRGAVACACCSASFSTAV